MFGRKKTVENTPAVGNGGSVTATAATSAGAATPATPATARRASTMPGLRLGASGINALYLRAYDGPLVVEAHDEADIAVETLDYDPRASQVEARIRGEELYLGLKASFNPRKPWQAVLPVRVGLRLKVPRSISLRTWTTSGSIRVLGVAGDVVLETERGRIDLNAPCRSLAVQTESGDADLRGLAGPLLYKAASGWLAATWDRAPESGTIDIRKAKGVTELGLPADTRLNLRFTLGPIAILNEFDSDAAAPVALHVTSRTGNLSVRKNRILPKAE